MSDSASNRRADTLIFLPGASGNTRVWQPVSDGLRHPGVRKIMSWPGFGGVPEDPEVHGISDLVDRVAAAITGPVDLLAQSMGGTIAIRAALKKPYLVRHLVLSVTSGGLDVASLGGQDWRPSYRAQNPSLPGWFLDEREDLTHRLRELTCPVLLLWGDADPISPIAVGRRLEQLFPRAELVVVKKGTHDLIAERAQEILPIIEKHLTL